MGRGWAGCVVFGAAALMFTGCTRGSSPPADQRVQAPPSAPAFALPNLASAAETVRAQLTDGHNELSALLASSRASSKEIADQYGKVGMLLLAANFYDAAEAAFLNAQARDPGEARWPYYLGHTYRQRNDPAKAVAAFERARAINPDDVPTLVWLGAVQLEAGAPENAAGPLSEALAREPRNARAMATLGRVALARRDYPTAITQFETALQLAPQATALHYQLSLAYRGAGDIARADEHLRQRGSGDVAMRDPRMESVAALLDSATAFDTRSREALTRGDWMTAAADARRGLELAGTNAAVRASLHHRLGTALAQMGSPADARREFENAIAASPEFAAGHYSLGVLLAGSGQPEAAIREFSLALQHEPAYLQARLARGDALRQRGRAAEALTDYRTVRQQEPDSPAAQYGEALALAGLGQHIQARDMLVEGMTRHAGDRSLALALARLLAASPDASVHDPARALSIAEPIVRAAASLEGVETLARALAGLGRFDEAAALQGQAAAQAQRVGQPALAAAMTGTQRLYQRRRTPQGLWREEPLYEPTGR